jgi:hypothetical protein
MCPFCHTPYEAEGSDASGRQSRMTPRLSMAGVPAPSGALGRPKPKPTISMGTKIGVPVLVVAFSVWYFVIAADRRIPAGVVIPNIVNAPMPAVQAEAFLARVNVSAKVETKSDELIVSIPLTMWPEKREGQIALAQQYARATEITTGKPHKISFLDPMGVAFAKADEHGVMMVR